MNSDAPAVDLSQSVDADNISKLDTTRVLNDSVKATPAAPTTPRSNTDNSLSQVVEGGAASPVRPDQEPTALAYSAEIDGFDWYSVYEQIQAKGLIASIAGHCQLVDKQGAQIYLRLDRQQSALYSPKIGEELQAMLSSLLGQSVQLQIEIGELDRASPYLKRQYIERREQSQRIDKFKKNKKIQALIKHFDGYLDESSVLEKKPS